MAEPLKSSFGVDVPERVADMVQAVYPAFDREAFVTKALDGYEDLELTARARRISDALATVLPTDRGRAIELLIDSLGPEIGGPALEGLGSFIYLPHVFFVADHGLECFETAMRAQYELTKRFTAELSIRAFIERYPSETMGRLAEWALDPSPHVRRLVSEGTRPRLPWAPRLRAFQEDPAPVVRLLEALKDDPAEYVRRSVANNLNDISKDHPERVVEIARRWWEGTTPERQRLVRRALRTLVKAGDAGALDVLGYRADTPVRVARTTCTPARVAIGEKTRVEVGLENPGNETVAVLVDLRVHFVKANGSTRPKVFKGGELTIGPGGTAKVRKSISFAQHSTRTHYPGVHRLEVSINGAVRPGCDFVVTTGAR